MKTYAKIVTISVHLLLLIWLGNLFRMVPGIGGAEMGLGLCFFGIINLLMRRKYALMFLNRGPLNQAGPMDIRSGFGKAGMELLFLGIGVILVLAGIAFLIKYFFSR